MIILQPDPKMVTAQRLGNIGKSALRSRVFACAALASALASPRHLGGYSNRMRQPARPSHGVRIRRGKPADLDALWDLENRVFETDRMTRRSLRRLLASPSAAAVVAQSDGGIAGVALVLFRATSRIARLYSLAVAPKHTGRGIASALLAAAEKAARSRQCGCLRLEVHEKNHGAIKVYRKAGYREFGRHHQYYQDRGHALRFEKALTRS
jgi:ribosomal protein S18 acetylase RimI-like enzyme